MNYSQTHHREKHYCNNFHCPHPQKLACNQFCISCNRTIGPHPTHEVKFEFVQVTKKELALQERLPPRSKLNLTYGYLPGRLRSMPENYRNPSLYPPMSYSDYWSNSQPLQNEYGQVLGYYRYTLVEHPPESSGRGGKLFWLMLFGAAVWFWFLG
ncbi:MAG: hypothetical protein P2A85_15645 [Microcoleus anatoxicus]|uniref:hypothetical protein n=1 Tax=Microcoleus anatoxicus TaxID=2705319 RepID=UPI00366FB1F7